MEVWTHHKHLDFNRGDDSDEHQSNHDFNANIHQPISFSIPDCMIAFIDRLSETEGMAVKMASIIGTAFTDDVLVNLMTHMPPDKVHQSIGALLSAGKQYVNCHKLFNFYTKDYLDPPLEGL